MTMQDIECLCHKTEKRPSVKYGKFDEEFYKFPSYLRRGAIMEAIGKVSSYRSNLAQWEETSSEIRGHKPGLPKAGYIYPCMYRTALALS